MSLMAPDAACPASRPFWAASTATPPAPDATAPPLAAAPLPAALPAPLGAAAPEVPLPREPVFPAIPDVPADPWLPVAERPSAPGLWLVVLLVVIEPVADPPPRPALPMLIAPDAR